MIRRQGFQKTIPQGRKSISERLKVGNSGSSCEMQYVASCVETSFESSRIMAPELKQSRSKQQAMCRRANRGGGMTAWSYPVGNVDLNILREQGNRGVA
jgi:hypothetical protein